MSPRRRASRGANGTPEAPGRYDWPAIAHPPRGSAPERFGFLIQRSGPVDRHELDLALERRRTPPAAEAVPSGDANLWVPIGPTVALEGSPGGIPRVTGRVRDLRVSDDGRRVYAATANGGVWYSNDAGETWTPLGGWAVSGTPPTVDQPANVLACGCLHVSFDAGGDPEKDEVLVGTGELLPQLLVRELSGTPASRASGVGVLRAVGPAKKAQFAHVWDVEGKNLANTGIFRIAGNPDQTPPTTFVAATSAGLWMRSGAPAANWAGVPASPFGDVLGATLICTDAAWVKGQGGTPTQLWVAVRDPAGTASGLWVSSTGTAGPFTPIALPGLQADSRITIAAAPSDPQVLYALANGSLVWRLDAFTVTRVTRIPPNFLDGQDDYNQAIAVHPTRPERIVLGGGSVSLGGKQSAQLFVANVTGPTGGSYRFGFTNTASPTADDSFVGQGVHPDVHAARFVPAAGGAQLWIGTDGGVFRSLQGDADNKLIKSSFVARNTGIAALEAGYVATHPTVDGYLLAGTHDNGTIERVGDTVWRARFRGDGGGVVFNPAAPHRFLYEVTKAKWRSDGTPGTTYVRPVLRSDEDPSKATAPERDENRDAGFYSGAEAVVTPTGARVALGTYRVWCSEDWGATWFTLPSLTDPMQPGSQNATTDATLMSGAKPDTSGGEVIVVRWATPNRLYVLCRRVVVKYDFVADASAPGGRRVTKEVLSRQAPGKCEDPQAAKAVESPGQVLPAVGEWSDLAVHDVGRTPHGSFYVAATGHPGTPEMDTLWWFDGEDRWHATGLRTDTQNGVPAPAYAVVVHPADRNVVFVGTSVGVWKGTLSFGLLGGPDWDWEPYVNGLPEATVQDLSTFNSGGVRLLRAALQSRGVWEVDLLAAGTARTYLRVHKWDTRRAATTSLTDPTKPVPNTRLSWHASPDIRVRPRRGSTPPNPTGLPWAGASTDAYGLWVFQTALHGRPDPLCKPDGEWTTLFAARLRAATGGNKVTLAIWRNIVGSGAAFPNAYAEPWNGASPSEADLIELIRDLPPAGGSPASMGIRPVQARVDVLVHHRHPNAVQANAVKVTLIRRDVSGTGAAAWAALAGTWAAPVQTFLRAGGAAPALPAGWSFADAANPVRSPAEPVDARLPCAVSFDVDFTGLAKGTRVLLVAVVHSSVDQVTLPNQALQNLVLGTRFAAVRSVEIV